MNQFYIEYDESFEFKFIPPDRLSASEKKIFDQTDKIFSLIRGRPQVIKEIKISETMKREPDSFVETLGLWDPKNGRIIIKRDQLATVEGYAGTLLHETTHAIGGKKDVSRDFESELTEIMGIIASNALKGDL